MERTAKSRGAELNKAGRKTAVNCFFIHLCRGEITRRAALQDSNPRSNKCCKVGFLCLWQRRSVSKEKKKKLGKEHLGINPKGGRRMSRAFVLQPPHLSHQPWPPTTTASICLLELKWDEGQKLLNEAAQTFRLRRLLPSLEFS